MGLRERRIEIDCLLRMILRFLERSPRGQEIESELDVGVGDPGVGQGVLRVLVDRLFVMGDALPEAGLGVFAPLPPPQDIEPIGFAVLRRPPGELPPVLVGQTELELVGDGVGQFLLDREEVRELAAVRLPPREDVVGLHVHQFAGDEQFVAPLADRAREHGLDAELPPHARGVVGCLALVRGGRAERPHLQLTHPREAADQAHGDPVAEEFGVGIAALIDKRQDRQRSDRAAPVGGFV